MATTSAGPARRIARPTSSPSLEGGRAFENVPTTRVDTQCATVFLVDDRAGKLKRAIKFDYLDLSTPEKRRAAPEAE